MFELKEKMKHLSELTDSVLLFHSATGKDSIMCLDLCKKYIKNVTCVFMYTVPNLTHVEKYINHSIAKYKVKFIQVPHYAISSYKKTGFLGCEMDEKTPIKNLNKIVDECKQYTGIEWAVFGFKRSDSMNRNLMMNKLHMNSFNLETKNAYPICDLSNKQVLQYCDENGLIEPIRYGSGRSQGASPSDADFLNWCRKYYPQDYQKVISYFPLAATIK